MAIDGKEGGEGREEGRKEGSGGRKVEGEGREDISNIQCVLLAGGRSPTSQARSTTNTNCFQCAAQGKDCLEPPPSFP